MDSRGAALLEVVGDSEVRRVLTKGKLCCVWGRRARFRRRAFFFFHLALGRPVLGQHSRCIVINEKDDDWPGGCKL